MICIFTAPIQSGKTTSLINWSSGRNDVYGILTPVVMAGPNGEAGPGKRVFMNAHTKQQFPMEATKDETEVLPVGRFTFSKANFKKAIQIIRDAVNKEGWLVIDEIGPLELSGEGFAELLQEVLALRKEKLVIVVREGLAGQVKEKFGLDNISILEEDTISMLTGIDT
jgi:nucleoside-triphosphatase THEP1